MKQEMKRGDHIYVKTKIPGVTHHGIYCGDGDAIHFDGHTKCIVKNGLINFSQPFNIEQIKVFKYPARLFAPGKINIFNVVMGGKLTASDDVSIVMQRAESLLGKSQYDLGRRNCEHFAVWCKTNTWYSPQINNVQGRIMARLISLGLSVVAIPWPINLIVAFVIFITLLPFTPSILSTLSQASNPPED